MSFVSFEFLLFLLILFVLYYALPRRFQWMLLLVGSLVFYAFASPKYLIYIAVTAMSTWAAGRAISAEYRGRDSYIKETPDITKEQKKARKDAAKKKAKTIMVLCLVLNLGILAVIKYTDFFIENWNFITGQSVPLMHIVAEIPGAADKELAKKLLLYTKTFRRA